MATTTTQSELNVSLELHLQETLQNVQPILPDALATKLAATLDQDPAKTVISYQLLQDISQWSRTPVGMERLRGKSTSPATLTMVALLAGTTTSPDRNFGEYVPPKEPEEVEFDKVKERKAITALINSLFSIFGAGFAAWWGADKTGWRDEYKVLFALFIGIVVAVSEAILYLIWTSREAPTEKRRRLTGRDKKLDEGSISTEESKAIMVSSKDEQPSNIRQRREHASL